MTNVISLPALPPGFEITSITPLPDGTFKYDIRPISVVTAGPSAIVPSVEPINPEPTIHESPLPPSPAPSASAPAKAARKSIPPRLAASVAPPSLIEKANANADKKPAPVAPLAWSEVASVPDVSPSATIPAAIAATPAPTPEPAEDSGGRGPDKTRRASPVMDVKERILRCIASHQRRNSKALAKEAYGNSGKAARKRVRSVLRGLEKDGLVMQEQREVWSLVPGALLPKSVQDVVQSIVPHTTPTTPLAPEPTASPTVKPAPVQTTEVAAEQPTAPPDPASAPASSKPSGKRRAAPKFPRGGRLDAILAAVRANPGITVLELAKCLYGGNGEESRDRCRRGADILRAQGDLTGTGASGYYIPVPAGETPVAPAGRKNPANLGHIKNVAAHITAFLTSNQRSSTRHICLHIYGNATARALHKTKARLRQLELSGLAAKDVNGLWVPAVKGVIVTTGGVPEGAAPAASRRGKKIRVIVRTYGRGEATKAILSFLRSHPWSAVKQVAFHLYGANDWTNCNRANTILHTLRHREKIVSDERNLYAIVGTAPLTGSVTPTPTPTPVVAPPPASAKVATTPRPHTGGRKPLVTDKMREALRGASGRTTSELSTLIYGVSDAAVDHKTLMNLCRMVGRGHVEFRGGKWYGTEAVADTSGQKAAQLEGRRRGQTVCPSGGRRVDCA